MDSNIANIIEIAELTATLGGFVVVIFKLLRFDRKLDGFALEKAARESEEMKQARIELTHTDKYIYIKNTGKSDARDLEMEIDVKVPMRIPDGFFPYKKLSPGQTISIRFAPEYLKSVHQNVMFKWEDDSSEEKRKLNLDVTLGVN